MSCALRPNCAARVRSICMVNCGKSSCTSKSILPIWLFVLNACCKLLALRPISCRLLPVILNCNFSERCPRETDCGDGIARTPGIASNSVLSILIRACWLTLRCSLGFKRTLILAWFTCPREPAPMVEK